MRWPKFNAGGLATQLPCREHFDDIDRRRLACHLLYQSHIAELGRTAISAIPIDTLTEARDYG
jgi:hypothetical protein